jgi:hypothetical protein
MSITLLSIFLLVAGGCTKVAPTTSNTSAPAISKEKAIAIAGSLVPVQVVERATIQIDDIGEWRILLLDVYTTQTELGWQKDNRTQFGLEQSDTSINGTYRNIIILVNNSTGNINLKALTNKTVFQSMPIITKTNK